MANCQVHPFTINRAGHAPKSIIVNIRYTIRNDDTIYIPIKIITLFPAQVYTTFNSIRVDTAYQTSGEVPLVYGDNIRRKFREYGVIIPRESGGRNRIRAPYAFIALRFSHAGVEDYSFTLYDTKVLYTIN